MMGICDCCGMTEEIKLLKFNRDYLCEDCYKHAKKILKKLL